MKTRGWIGAAAALAVSAALAGPALADDSLDALTPMNSEGLGDVKGAVAAEGEADPALGAVGTAAPSATAAFDAASTLSGNEANNVGLGVVSLTNNVENSALSLSHSLLNGSANTP